MLTPTALSAYMSCSLKFYFRYIAKIEETEVVTEDIESSVFGKILHFAMEWIYKPYEDLTLQEEHFLKITGNENIEQALLVAFNTIYFKSAGTTEKLHGKSIVIKEILKKYLIRILEIDSKNCPFKIHSLEKRVLTQYVTRNKLGVTIGGIVDRLDEVNNTLRIIDYKTGNIEFSAPGLKQLFDREGDTSKFSAIFQSVLYSIVIARQEEFNGKEVYPALYGLRKIFNDNFDMSVNIEKQTVNAVGRIETEFLYELETIIEELFNPLVPFTKTTDVKKCEICPYREICQR